MVTSLSGRQYELSSGPYRAAIASVGASLRALTVDGRDLVVPYDADEVRPVYRGATLAPWPNRVVEGRYAFGGVLHELALTEPKRGHALHGLVAWLDFAEVAVAADSVVLAASIVPQAGYPFAVDVLVAYELDADGLHETVTATNVGPSPAPWGTGPHPYLVAGDGRVDDWTLESSATRVLQVTDDRLIPVSLDPVPPAFDFRSPRPIGDTFIDHAFTGFASRSVTITAPNGTGVRVTWDEACGWLQVHTADRPDAPELSRIGLAVEPMTCPPDAFNSGTDVVVLAPAASTSAGWTIAAL
ncbi:aldose 1-epimerase family protein [Galbitalea sp. SE-J8]|uniref:aldose 1-epimerase family protein n=1 Tax=Galbitalea sp. SE-J8 TaxID=3054952 RepID=UPI00259D12C2|nr:aldose 1-epimerase family protein [Galbitalea sp. SE-J8]MDM4762005.1 aldose 1-epimerase family protein [Galbitalea sp. SE-J8]